MTKTADPLAVLIELNAQVAAAEADGDSAQRPGLASFITDPGCGPSTGGYSLPETDCVSWVIFVRERALQPATI
jgi:hypothetical protein